jgi:MFS transporter, DHA1 family, inner membrane transport protein
MNWSLFALAAAAFGVGTTEFVVMGILPDLAADLQVGIPEAGMIITAYAAGVVVGAPITAVLSNGMPRKAALLVLIGLFIAGNLACALAPGYFWLIGARVLTAFCHAAFFGIAATLAADLVPPDRRGRAVALVFAGLTVANIFGVPGGTALGTALGWRATFLAVAVIGLAAIGLVATLLPQGPAVKRSNLRAEFAAAARPQVVAAMTLTVLTSASLFAVFSFIAPILSEVTRLDPGAIAGALMLFGVGMTIGGLIGGRLADWRPGPALLGSIVVLIVVMSGFSLATAVAPATLVMIFAWGVAIFALAPALQMRVMAAAAGAPTLASTLNQAAFNLGNAAGAAIGAASLSYGISYAGLPRVGVAIAVFALAFAGAPLVIAAMGRLADGPAPLLVVRHDLFEREPPRHWV